MLVVAVTTLAGLSLTYAVEPFEKFRPWIEGEEVPFAWWITGQRGPAAEDDDPGVSEELLAEALDGVEEEDEDDEELLAPPPEAPVVKPKPVAPKPVAPKVETPTPKMPTEAAPVEKPVVVVEKPEPPPRYTVDPKEYAGITREIEDSSGKALDHFYAALEKTADGAGTTRISHWGASVIGADGITSVVRRKLQKQFGSAGKGWVNLAPGWDWYRQKDVVFKSKGWHGKTVTRHKLKERRHGRSRYGYGGVGAIGGKNAKSSYRVYANRLELYYHAYPKGGDLEITVDGGTPIALSTLSENAHDAWKVVEAEGPGEHSFQVKVTGGRVHAYGVTLESDGPGVVYDCLGMIGTRASRILNYDPEHLNEQVAHRGADLQIIMFGGNELQDKGMGMKWYEDRYDTVIKALRAGAPDKSCLIMTPIDHGEKVRGRVRTVPMLKRMIPVQQRIAERNGCAFFNTWQAMGGEGSVGKWYRHRPRLAWGDYAHLTKAGDKVMGAIIYKALMKGFADYLLRDRSAVSPVNP